MNIETIFLVIIGIVVLGVAIMSWRFENISNVEPPQEESFKGAVSEDVADSSGTEEQAASSEKDT